MRLPQILLSLTIAVMLAPPASAARRKPEQVAPPPGPVACTRGYCRPVPPGCHTVPEMLPEGMPSGYDNFVCPHAG